ncbi:MAG: type I-B CRISPR-associated protein Cas7/Cst2/DevR [Candidatus Anstonellales archaeon]
MGEEVKLPKYVIYDVVFEGMSLNYDEGVGNIQELKKIVMPNGLAHTMMSRYALRYSILETMESLGGKGFADPNVFTQIKGHRGGNQAAVIQVDFNKIIDGTILEYQEFCLFGFLVTDPQIQRENPVKISHAISLTPFNNDILFYANHSFAKRFMKKEKNAKLEPSPFNKEEHYTFYGYTVIVDVEKIRKFEFTSEVDKKVLLGIITTEKEIKDFFNEPKNINENVYLKVTEHKSEERYIVDVMYKLSDDKIKELLKDLESAILHLKRNHQGRQEDLKPKIVIKQEIYDDNNNSCFYQTYLDRIRISNTYTEQVDIREEKKSDNTTSYTTKKQIIRGIEFFCNVPNDSTSISLEQYLKTSYSKSENHNNNNHKNKTILVVDGFIDNSSMLSGEEQTWLLNSRFVSAKLKLKKV